MTNNKIAYETSRTITITLDGGLASSADFTAGRQSTLESNSTDLDADYLLFGEITVGTSPVINTQIRVYCFGYDADVSYPDTFGATDANVTLSSAGAGLSFLKLAAILNVDTTTSDKTYSFGAVSIASLFGGVIPTDFGFFVTHNTNVNLNTTAANHKLIIRGVYSTNG